MAAARSSFEYARRRRVQQRTHIGQLYLSGAVILRSLTNMLANEDPCEEPEVLATDSTANEEALPKFHEIRRKTTLTYRENHKTRDYEPTDFEVLDKLERVITMENVKSVVRDRRTARYATELGIRYAIILASRLPWGSFW